MSKNLYRVCKKSDLDEIIKNNFFKPICIIFTTKDTNKEFEDNIAELFKKLSKQNTYCMHLLINLDNFIDNINFFGEMRLNSPNFIAYFKGKQISSCSNTQNNKDLFLTSTKDIINKINTSYVQKLVVSFNQDEHEKEESKLNKEKNKNNEQYNNKEEDNDEEDNDEEDNDEEDNNEDNEEDKEDEEDEKEEDEKENNQEEENEKNVNNIKKRNIEPNSDKKEVNLSKTNLSKTDLSKVDLSKVDLSKVNLNKLDLSKVDLEQLSIDKKKEKLKELLELKKQVQKN
jgi:hypothetical protein